MTDNTEAYLKRYHAALGKMQSGVAFEMNYSTKSTEPKHLRVGVNSALVDSSSLATLLMKKGIITLDEYLLAMAEGMEAEVVRYEKHLSDNAGHPVTLGGRWMPAEWYCKCESPSFREILGLGVLCGKCWRWQKPADPIYGRHTYREHYSERRCEICGEEKGHQLHVGATPVEE